MVNFKRNSTNLKKKTSSFRKILVLEQHRCNNSIPRSSSDTILIVITVTQLSIYKLPDRIQNAVETEERNPAIEYRANERRHKPTFCSKHSIMADRNTFYLMSLKGKFKCSFCPKRATREPLVRKHEITVHSGDTPFICSICSSAFNRDSFLKFHIMYHHRNTALYSDTIERSNLTVQEESNDVLQSSTVTEKSHENSSEKDRLICKKCNKSFSTINWLARHKKRCADQKHDKRFQCSFCNAMFTMNQNRYRHEQRFHSRNFSGKIRKNLIETHQRDAQRRCKISDSDCSETQPVSKSPEKNTRRLKSTGRVVIRTPGGVEMIYANELCCSYCPKFFANERTKQVHEKIHTGDWTYQCRYCSVLFRLPQLLDRHEKKCLTLTDTIWCQFCDYQNKLQSVVDHHYSVTHGFDVNQSKIQVSDANQSEILLPEESEGNFELSSFIDVPEEESFSEDENIPVNKEDDHWSQFNLISDDDDG